MNISVLLLIGIKQMKLSLQNNSEGKETSKNGLNNLDQENQRQKLGRMD